MVILAGKVVMGKKKIMRSGLRIELQRNAV